ncbi:hypothetical protein BOO86_00625 [Mycobacterium sp. CBMA 234]|uniref:YciI family protein n=1 Tax=Mycolicibacterium sp. CBMA 234 TaxID=1918495 RepID=UPI0012DD4432|nr:YciI family protein [Mycolicibacterium sp. CBMA 234]MUL62951.1 hypothetical protein [Mycolicibacterium sp. CBMA 234]
MHQPVGDPPPPEVLDPIMNALNVVENDMKSAGVWVFSGGLHGPEASTVVRVHDGATLTTDGPYVEGKEHLGGFTIIDVADLDSALTWAHRQAQAVRLLPIEVRPFRGALKG